MCKCLFACASCVPGVHRDQKRLSDLVELEQPVLLTTGSALRSPAQAALSSQPGPFPPFLPRGARRESSTSCNLISGCFLFQPLTPVETSPEPIAQLSTSLESLASLSLTSSPECSSSESDHTASWKDRQQKAPQKPVQEKKSKPPVSSKPRGLDMSLTLIKNEVRRQHLMSEILQKVQMKKKRSLFPTPKSRECWSVPSFYRWDKMPHVISF